MAPAFNLPPPASPHPIASATHEAAAAAAAEEDLGPLRKNVGSGRLLGGGENEYTASIANFSSSSPPSFTFSSRFAVAGGVAGFFADFWGITGTDSPLGGSDRTEGVPDDRASFLGLLSGFVLFRLSLDLAVLTAAAILLVGLGEGSVEDFDRGRGRRGGC